MRRTKHKNVKRKDIANMKVIFSIILMVISFGVVGILGYSFAIDDDGSGASNNAGYQYYKKNMMSHHLINNNTVGINQLKTVNGNEIDLVYSLINDGSVKENVTLDKIGLDSTNYSEEDVKKLNAILSMSYPYVSLDEMKSNLMYVDEAKFSDAKLVLLDTQEVMSAVQAAIWSIDGNTYNYSNTNNSLDATIFNNGKEKQNWNTADEYLNAITKTNEDLNIVFDYSKNSEDVRKRINATIDILLKSSEFYFRDITTFEIDEAIKTVNDDGTYDLKITVLSTNPDVLINSIKSTFIIDGNELVNSTYSQSNNKYIYEFNNVKLNSNNMDISVDATLGNLGKVLVYKSDNLGVQQYIGLDMTDGVDSAKASFNVTLK